jgi:uncharacterized protein YkwD
MHKLLTALLTSVVASAPVAAQPMDGFGSHLAELINRYRQDHGLAPLSVAPHLVALASEHSADMATRGRLTHDGFDHRFKRAGSRVCVENVGWNYATAEGLMDGWRRSAAHHRNLLDAQVSYMGIGMNARYATFFACL